jgi:radical SAM superfamily enzyme YgiQ (UPF0313 family)
MERGVSVSQVQAAVSLCRAHGIQTGMFLMWGYEGEELEDIEATIQHVRTTKPDIFFTTVAYPIKGTPYFSEVAGRVENLKPWNTGSDREVQIRGRHSRRFYSFADQLLRSEVELERLKDKRTQDVSLMTELQDKIGNHRANLLASAAEVES